MSSHYQEFVSRQIARVAEIARGAEAAPEGEMIPLKILTPDMLVAVDIFQKADTALADIETSYARSLQGVAVARNKLVLFFDQIIPGIMKKIPGISIPAASSYRTPDDFLLATEKLEHRLESHAEAPWAAAILSKLSPLLDAAAKEQAELTARARALQKAKAARERACVAVREEMLPFRRAVRATFGSSSKEYRDLLDMRRRNGKSEEAEAETVGEATVSSGEPANRTGDQVGASPA